MSAVQYGQHQHDNAVAALFGGEDLHVSARGGVYRVIPYIGFRGGGVEDDAHDRVIDYEVVARDGIATVDGNQLLGRIGCGSEHVAHPVEGVATGNGLFGGIGRMYGEAEGDSGVAAVRIKSGELRIESGGSISAVVPGEAVACDQAVDGVVGGVDGVVGKQDGVGRGATAGADMGVCACFGSVYRVA